MVIENPNPIPLEYPTLLEVLKKELAQDPKKSLVSFCEKHSINYDHLTDGSEPPEEASPDYAMKYA